MALVCRSILALAQRCIFGYLSLSNPETSTRSFALFSSSSHLAEYVRKLMIRISYPELGPLETLLPLLRNVDCMRISASVEIWRNASARTLKSALLGCMFQPTVEQLYFEDRHNMVVPGSAIERAMASCRLVSLRNVLIYPLQEAAEDASLILQVESSMIWNCSYKGAYPPRLRRLEADVRLERFHKAEVMMTASISALQYLALQLRNFAVPRVPTRGGYLRALPHWTPVLEVLVLSLVITAPSSTDTFSEGYSTLDHAAPDLPRLPELRFSLRFSGSTPDMDAHYKAYVDYISTQLPSAQDNGLLAFFFVSPHRPNERF
ncbi:hypothetical protein C8J57DRAFT_1212484 [Mycena rebaudengoi]|nr:hypothetical protein C8J57DRAFT_1212484 [Mycena rebaudengoi]